MYLWIVGAIAVLAALSVSYIGTHPQGILDGEHEGDVRSLVASFSNQMDSVSLQDPDVASTIRKVYGPYVAPQLIEVWVQNPFGAPGRLTSSPSPDHIEIASVTKEETGIYTVTGVVILTTSTGEAGRIPVSLTVENIEGHFLITSYKEEHTAGTSSASYADVTVALNEQVEAFGVLIQPTDLLEDSRCPLDVQCIQAGTVRTDVALTDRTGTHTTTFALGAVPISIETVSITLTKVEPAPQSKVSRVESDYHFTFHIEKR
jgi:hypothetical protein